MDRKGQAWGVDLIVGVIIFLIGIMIFFIYSINYSPASEDAFERVSDEASAISESIMSEGSPSDWNETDVLRIGILDGDKINQEKLENFYALSQTDYNLTKSLLNTIYDYYLVIDSNVTVGASQISGIGKYIDLTDIQAENLVKITRASIYQNKPVSVYIYVWN